MADEPDGIDDAFESTLRVGLTAAGRMAERAARAREAQMRDAQAASEQEARELAGRLQAERGAARAALVPVTRDEWWTNAQPQEISQAWETAVQWRDRDPQAANAAEHMRGQLRDRYGVDVDNLAANPGAVSEALERRERELQAAATQDSSAARDQAEAQLLLRDSDQARQDDEPQHAAAEHDHAEALYDSAERRRDLAAGLDGVADEQTVEARVIADTHQGRPAREAVAQAPQAAPNAKRGRGASGRTQERVRGR